MAKINLDEIKRNFQKLCQLTDFCIKLRISYLKNFHKEKAKEKFFEEILEEKEKNWRRKHSWKKIY